MIVRRKKHAWRWGAGPPVINEWSLPSGQGFYNIEFAADGGTLWVSDLNGGAVYQFSLVL